MTEYARCNRAGEHAALIARLMDEVRVHTARCYAATNRAVALSEQSQALGLLMAVEIVKESAMPECRCRNRSWSKPADEEHLPSCPLAESDRRAVEGGPDGAST